MSSIFIAYRRDDSGDITGRIYDRLVGHYGQNHVFRDVTSLQGGQRFPARLENAITEQTVMLVIIGQRWLQLTQERREDPYDFGRIEIEIALRQHATIIPVLVQGATMPTQQELPPSISDFANYHSINVRADPDFTHDVELVQRAVGIYIPPTARRFPWLAVVSLVLVVAIIGGLVWHFGRFGASPTVTVKAPTATATLSQADCSDGPDSQGRYKDPFSAVPLKSVLQPPDIANLTGVQINVGGAGDAFSAFATARAQFDQVNHTCTQYLNIRASDMASITPLITSGTPAYQIAVTDGSLSEMRPVQNAVTQSLHSIQLGVIVNVVVVNANIAASVKNLTHSQLAAIYEGKITKWNEGGLNGPNVPIEALWPGDAATLSTSWQTNQSNPDTTVNGPVVSFQRNILGDSNASASLITGFSKADLLGKVAGDANAIGFTTLESWLHYAVKGAVPVAIDGISPIAPDGTMSPTIKDAINAGTYVFWDIAHAYMTNSFYTTPSPQNTAALAMIEEIRSNAFADSAFSALGWVYWDDISGTKRLCHDKLDYSATCPG